MTDENAVSKADPGIFGLISALGVLFTLVFFIWFFKAYLYDAPIVTTFGNAGMLFSPHERLLIWPIAVITLVAGILAARRAGSSLVRPSTYLSVIVLAVLGLLELNPVRRAAVSFYYKHLDSDLSRIETQVGSIFHPAYGDVLLADPAARATFRAAATGGSFFLNKDSAALILFALDRLEGKSTLKIALKDPAGRERFLRVLSLEKDSPLVGHVKAPAKIAAPTGPGFRLGFIQPRDARTVFEQSTTQQALAVFGYRAVNGKALTVDLSLDDRWVLTRMRRTKTTTRAVQKRRPYTNTRDPLRFQTYTVYADEKSTVQENVSLRLPVMKATLTADGTTEAVEFRTGDGSRDKPAPGPAKGRKIVDALDARECLKYSVQCFEELTTRRLTPLHTIYEIQFRDVSTLPARK